MLPTIADALATGAERLPSERRPTSNTLADHVATSPRPLKLAVIAETMLTGVGRHVSDTVRALARRGHDVHLLHSRARADAGLLAEIAAGSDARLQAFDLSHEVGWRDAAALIELARYLWAHGPFDIIHGHSSKGGLYARLLGLIFRSECVYSPHAFITLAPGLSPSKHMVYSVAERCLGSISRMVLCSSEQERQHALELGIAAHRVHVIPNGIDHAGLPAAADLRRQIGLAPDRFVVGFVGRLDEQKAPGRILEAARIVVERNRRVCFVMIGDGPLRAALEREVLDRGLGSAFVWLGQRPARSLIPGFDVLAMPSRYEGCAYAMLEALAVGVPVVCTPVGGVNEAVEDGLNGFIVAHEDANAFAERILRLARDPMLRARMATAARRSADKFTLGASVDRIERAYFAALSGLRIAASARATASVTGLYERLMPRRTVR